jgi:hypothetical protein
MTVGTSVSIYMNHKIVETLRRDKEEEEKKGEVKE